MCGEHLYPSASATFIAGSSPHVRGARNSFAICRRSPGIIPACAGSTSDTIRLTPVARDHPRMCGEHHDKRAPSCWLVGSSPHVRGAPVRLCLLCSMEGIIPACAGSTESSACPSRAPGDHPRMCGEHPPWKRWPASPAGSSPHVRGAHRKRRPISGTTGIIPACAGSTSELDWGTGIRLGSSPHVRGAHELVFRRQRLFGIIPACAGSTQSETTSR